MQCPICAEAMAVVRRVYDDRYGYPGLFPLARCPACGHKALALRDMDATALCELYTRYYPRGSFDLADFSPAPEARGFRGWLGGMRCAAYLWVPAGVRVLDIGCGVGATLAYHSARGCEAHGVEADENVRHIAQALKLEVQIGLFDPELYAPESFDYVTLDQVVEHFPDPVATLRGIARVLKPGGVVVASTPNSGGWGARIFGRRWINWHAPYHLQHFSRRSMELAAGMAGLELVEARTLTSSEWLYYQWVHLVTCPRQGVASPFWSPGGVTGKGARPVLALLRLVHRTKVNHLLTRVADLCGAGDNSLFFLRKP
ncbi:methyltransferase domain-containing protein [Geomonas sp. RF6]|uniref:methyltransferase domain-containing protein n=1 Tax=Geomonas sp. RF6 TaxID=2897342 RepID=UPI001E514C3C|nr:methyltransferase domain-containing protein [Geomonas sp. RF6]UFS69725.1 methyltransferase domain-containing protein [Geomonas sp. RF6]